MLRAQPHPRNPDFGRGGGWVRRCAEGAAFRPRSDSWLEAELSACCATANSSSALSCWRTCLSSEVAASGQPHNSMAAAARFCDARLKSGGASPPTLVSTFAPSLARRSLSCVRSRAGGVGARARGCLSMGRRSCRSLFPSRRCSCTGTCCGASNGAGCWLRGSWSSSSSRWRLASSSSS
jgi:hypothetical protein